MDFTHSSAGGRETHPIALPLLKTTPLFPLSLCCFSSPPPPLLPSLLSHSFTEYSLQLNICPNFLTHSSLSLSLSVFFPCTPLFLCLFYPRATLTLFLSFFLVPLPLYRPTLSLTLCLFSLYLSLFIYFISPHSLSLSLAPLSFHISSSSLPFVCSSSIGPSIRVILAQCLSKRWKGAGPKKVGQKKEKPIHQQNDEHVLPPHHSRMSTTSPSLLSSAASPASSSHQNGRPFSISSLLHSSQNFEPKYPPLGTAAAFSDALQQCLPMLFAARGIIGEGTTAGIGAAQFSNVFQPKLMGKERTKEEEKEENGEEADEVPTSEESSQSEDDGTMGKGIEEKMEMKEEEEELEKSELNMNKEQKQMKAEGEEEEADKIKEKEDKGGITPEGCFVPWLFPVLPPLPAHHHHHQQPPSLPLPSPTTGGRCPPLFPAPFIPAFLKSPFSLPAQFLLSAGTFPTVCGPCAPQSAQQQQHNQNNHNHQQQQQHNSGHHHQHKRKGGQIRFSNEQTDILESTFEVRKYLNNMERKRLARALELHERQVKTWFQNRRAKWRRQTPAVTENSREGEESISETVGGTAMAAAEQHNQQQHHHHAFELYMQRQ